MARDEFFSGQKQAGGKKEARAVEKISVANQKNENVKEYQTTKQQN